MVARREFVYTVFFSLKWEIRISRSREEEPTAANAEEKCNIDKSVACGEDLWCALETQ